MLTWVAIRTRSAALSIILHVVAPLGLHLCVALAGLILRSFGPPGPLKKHLNEVPEVLWQPLGAEVHLKRASKSIWGVPKSICWLSRTNFVAKTSPYGLQIAIFIDVASRVNVCWQARAFKMSMLS